MATRGSNSVRRYNYATVSAYTDTAPVAGDTWTHLPLEGAPEGTREQAVDAAAVANARGNDSPDYATVKRGELGGIVVPTFGGTLGLDGAGGDTAPTSVFLDALHASYFGVAKVSAAGTTCTTNGVGSVADPMDVTSATGLVVGMAVQVNGQFRVITAISGTAIVLNADLSPAPANLDPVYASFMYKPTLGELASYLYINEELANGEGYLYGPGRITALSLNGLAAGNGLKWGATFQGNTWTDDVTPASFTANAFTASPLVAAAGEVMVSGTSTCISDGSVDFGVKHQWRPCATATEGRDGAEIIGASPSVSVTEYFSASRLTQFTGRTGLNVMLAFSNGATNAAKARHAVVVWMPNAQAMTAGAAIDGVRGMSTSFAGRDPTSAQVTAGITAPIYLSIFGGIA